LPDLSTHAVGGGDHLSQLWRWCNIKYNELPILFIDSVILGKSCEVLLLIYLNAH
jgi:hypothetical protein